MALWPVPAAAQLELQGFLGSSESIPSRVTITQAGQPDIRATAHWDTRPFQDTWYYAGRIGVWKGQKGWFLDFTHHKLYWDDRPAAVQRFQITNGMNMLTVSRGFRRGRFSYSFGAGPVITFPVNRVRGQWLGEGRGFWGGYFLSGGNLMATGTRRFPLMDGVFLSLDGRASFSYVRVPVAGGHAAVPNFALHFHAGLGFSPRSRPQDRGRS
jgi:hypothetical protein